MAEEIVYLMLVNVKHCVHSFHTLKVRAGRKLCFVCASSCADAIQSQTD